MISIDTIDRPTVRSTISVSFGLQRSVFRHQHRRRRSGDAGHFTFLPSEKAESKNAKACGKITARFNNKYRHLRPAVGSFVEKTLRESIL